MSIFGAEMKNVRKQQKTEYLKKLADAAKPHLNSSDSKTAGDANFTLGRCLLEQGKIRPAVDYFRHAISKQPLKAEYLGLLAKAELMLREEEPALLHAQLALNNLSNETAMTLNTLGYVFSRFGNYKTALHLFEQAVELEPNNIDQRDNLATTYCYFGKTKAALEQYEAILELDPCYGKAHLGIADLKKATTQNNNLERLKNASEDTSRKIESIRIQYALAKEFEDLNCSEQAFQHLHAANTDFMSNLKFDVKNDERLIQTFLNSYQNDLKHQKSDVEDKVLFVVGIPRTGTTLVDRILSAHSSIVSAGELQSMPVAVKQASNTNTKIVLDIDTIQKATKQDIGRVGRYYISNARLHTGANGNNIFSDKLPLNFMYAGFILKALPNAKIVCLRRNPMDTVWSNYKHLFGGGARYHTYSYNLESTARFYTAYKKLTDFWAKEFPDRFLILNYENLVQNQELETRKLLSHCDLNWEEKCLDFHSSSEAIATPSASQVRKPLHSGSIDKWKRYSKELNSTRDFFLRNGIQA